MAQMVKNQPAMQETWVRSLGQEDALKKGTDLSLFIIILHWYVSNIKL